MTLVAAQAAGPAPVVSDDLPSATKAQVLGAMHSLLAERTAALQATAAQLRAREADLDRLREVRVTHGLVWVERLAALMRGDERPR